MTDECQSAFPVRPHPNCGFNLENLQVVPWSLNGITLGYYQALHGGTEHQSKPSLALTKDKPGTPDKVSLLTEDRLAGPQTLCMMALRVGLVYLLVVFSF